MKADILRKHHSFRSQSLGAYLMLGIILIVNIILQGSTFLNTSTINSVFLVNTPLILATIAQAVVIFAGGIDLSIGAVLSVVNAFAITAGTHVPLAVAWLGAFLIAVLAGAVKGYVIAYLKVPAILATFALTYILEGTALLILPRPGGLVPSSVYQIYGGSILKFIPVSAVIVAVVICLYILVEKRNLGIQIKAAGAAPRSLFIAGLPVEKTKMKAYIISGAVTGLSGLCLTALASSGDSTIGNEMSLNTIAAAILGGISLNGGIGTVGGAAAGALFLGIVKNMINFIFNHLVSASTVLGMKISNVQSLLTNVIVILGLCSTLLTDLKKRGRKG